MKDLLRAEDLASVHVLDEIEKNPSISQRELSRRLGVSLGLTNLLLRRMARKAWIKVRSVPGRRLIYALTPRGFAEKLRKMRDFVRLSFRYHVNLQDTIERRISEAGRTSPRVASFGAGELAAIVSEAVRKAGGIYAGAGTDESPADLVIILERPERGELEAWEGAGLVLINLS